MQDQREATWKNKYVCEVGVKGLCGLVDKLIEENLVDYDFSNRYSIFVRHTIRYDEISGMCSVST